MRDGIGLAGAWRGVSVPQSGTACGGRPHLSCLLECAGGAAGRAAAAAREQLNAAVLRQEAAARLAAQAAGGAVVERGRAKAVSRFTRRKKAASGKAASGKGSGKGSGRDSGKVQTRLKLVPVNG